MNIDRRFLNVQLLIDSIANTPASTSAQYIVGSKPSGAFEGAAPNSIAYYDSKNEKWIFIAPGVNVLEVFNVSTKEFLRWDGSSWAVKVSLKTLDLLNMSFFVTYCHTITQEEIDNKSIYIVLNSSSYYQYQFKYVALFLNGVLQIIEKDFILSSDTGDVWRSGNLTSNPRDVSIKWYSEEFNKYYDFNNMDIRAGDIIALQLMAIQLN